MSLRNWQTHLLLQMSMLHPQSLTMDSEQSEEKDEAVVVDVGEAATTTATLASAVVPECVILISFLLPTNCD